MLMLNQLIGFGAGGEPLTTLTQQASATSTGATITGPASIIAGDLIVLWDVARGAPLPTSVVPTGFTSIANFTGSSARAILSYKIADGSEASATITGMDGNLADTKTLYVFRGNVPIVVATPTDVASEATDNNPAAQTVNASGAAVPLVVLGGYYSATATGVDPRTFTVGGSAAKDGEINANTAGVDNWLAYKIYAASPADVVIDMDDEGSENTLVSCYIACS